MTRHYRPFAFFALTYALSWIPWFAAARFSYRPGQDGLDYLCQLAGLLGPFASALILTSGDSALQRDFRDRLTNFGRLNWLYLPITLLLMPVAAYGAVWLSVRLGRPREQLALVPDLVSMLPIMFLAPAFEELGWRGYGVDALRARLGMRDATLLFAVLWAIWHVPLFFINHSYQHDLWLMSPLYVANFFVSVIPAAIIANWLYYKHRRFIPAAILFHFMLDAVAESFAIEQFTKCLITTVFLVVAVAVMLIDRKAFREGPATFVDTA
jgi:membrane protease YdiL (CAAX protease family)